MRETDRSFSTRCMLLLVFIEKEPFLHAVNFYS